MTTAEKASSAGNQAAERRGPPGHRCAPRVTVLAIFFAGLHGCAAPSLSHGAAAGLQEEFLAACQETVEFPEATAPVEAALVRFRRTFESVCQRERETLFEELPQGLRLFSGTPPVKHMYLREGLLDFRSYVRDAIDSNSSYEDLGRHVNALQLLDEELKEVSVAMPHAGPLQGSALYQVANKGLRTYLPPRDDLYAEVLKRIQPGPDQAQVVSIVTAWLPYTTACGRSRIRSYALYFADGRDVLGFDVFDTDEVDHVRPLRHPSWYGVAGSYVWRGLSWISETVFASEICGVNPMWPVNKATSAAVQGTIFLKELAFEVVKAPLAALASLISDDSSGERIGRSFAAPFQNIGEIAKYRACVIAQDSDRVTPLVSLDRLLQAVPVIGNYMPHYFDDPWTEFSEAAPVFKHSEAPNNSSEQPFLFLSRGIHGRGADQQGNENWIEFIRGKVGLQQIDKHGVRPGPTILVHESPYPWGTVCDPVFSLLNLSHGYAYRLANDVRATLRKECPNGTPIVSFLAHSGGVQRSTMASRFLWDLDVFTDTIYGVAGPSSRYAPTKPGQNYEILSKSEFQDADLTSGISVAVAAVEDWLILPFDLPLVGSMWWLTVSSRGYSEEYKNNEILRIEGRSSTLHRNPGMMDALRRDPSLTFFREDLLPILVRKGVLRRVRAMAVPAQRAVNDEPTP